METRLRVLTVTVFIFLFFLFSFILYLNIQSTFYVDNYCLWFYVAIFVFGCRMLFAQFLYDDNGVDNHYFPTLTLVIPVKNEESNIYNVIKNCRESDYPTDLLEIIVINDGSTDNTTRELKKAVADFSNIKLIHFEKNLGKRYAIRDGVKRATGEIILFVDSDTYIRKNAFYNIVQQFVDKEIGAIAGNTLVKNDSSNLLTRLQAFKYFMAFRMFKSFESYFGVVTCCPGCFSAYRKSYLLEFIDRWIDRSFMGLKLNLGEDRSLTNQILRKYKTIYRQDAIAETIAPTAFKMYLKQQIRWVKSWFTESFVAATFMWKKSAFPALLFYLTFFISLMQPVVILTGMIINFRLAVIVQVGLVIVFSIMQGFFCILKHEKELINYSLPFNVVYYILLVWLIPISALTFYRNTWGTR